MREKKKAEGFNLQTSTPKNTESHFLYILIQIPGHRPNKQLSKANGEQENRGFFCFERILQNTVGCFWCFCCQERGQSEQEAGYACSSSLSRFCDISGIFPNFLSPLPTCPIPWCTSQGRWDLEPCAPLWVVSKSFELLEFCCFAHFPSCL